MIIPAASSATKKDKTRGEEAHEKDCLVFRAGGTAAGRPWSLRDGTPSQADSGMWFFITSAGTGKGADLGGLEGADALPAAGPSRRCRGDVARLSQHAGRGRPASMPATHRRGPWQNAKGVVIARDVAELHGANNLTKETALTEKGEVVNGRGDTPNMHDILTGSQPDGTAFTAAEDRTCGNWTKSGAEGAAMVGHHDRTGLRTTRPPSPGTPRTCARGGCSQEA